MTLGDPEYDAGDPRATDEIVRENGKLRKIVKVLVDRVERSTDAQGSAFSLFQAATTLESTVRQRTAELQELNRQLSREIEERRKIEAALQIAKLEAERANLGKTAFLAAASHDLLQPLNVARLFADALAERSHDGDTRRMVGNLDRALEAAESLLGTLLDMSRLDAGAQRAELADVEIDPLLERLATEYGLSAEDRGLRLRVLPTRAFVRTDLGLLERVVRNLIGNALSYTSRGGVLVCGRRRGERLRLEVWDTGSGIAEADLDQIFVEFKRLQSDASHDADGLPRMGLGLAIVQRIARLLDARLAVRSRVGRGTVFSLELPLVAAVAPAPATAPLAAAAISGDRLRGRTVLLVDDDVIALAGLRTVLEGWGMGAIVASSKREAVGALAGRGARPEAILADYHLERGETGIDVIDAVHELYVATIPAIVLSADPNNATRRHVDERGFAWLPKPVRAERLRSLLAHLLAA